ncbi:MAG: membrane integrity-associated transporter subunit PqiC [Sphingomonadaceae bacterium]
MKRLNWIALCGVLLAGCASVPPERFYSLSNGQGLGPGPATAAAPYYIEVQAVSVPPQVARSQLVVTQGAGRVELLEQERWSAPLASEIGQALSQTLSAELGTIDVFRTPTPEQATVYRISTNVQRFESAPGQYALLDVVWSVRAVGSNAVLTCRTIASEPVGAGYAELVAGHRRALIRLAADIARAVRSQSAGKAGCAALP